MSIPGIFRPVAGLYNLFMSPARNLPDAAPRCGKAPPSVCDTQLGGSLKLPPHVFLQPLAYTLTRAAPEVWPTVPARQQPTVPVRGWPRNGRHTTSQPQPRPQGVSGAGTVSGQAQPSRGAGSAARRASPGGSPHAPPEWRNRPSGPVWRPTQTGTVKKRDTARPGIQVS